MSRWTEARETRSEQATGDSPHRLGESKSSLPITPRRSAASRGIWDALAAFFDFLSEHGKHLRTSNVIESRSRRYDSPGRFDPAFIRAICRSAASRRASD
jgi:hypothetical protein